MFIAILCVCMWVNMCVSTKGMSAFCKKAWYTLHTLQYLKAGDGSTWKGKEREANFSGWLYGYWVK